MAEEKNIYKLELNEYYIINGWIITRVQGGWIYHYCYDGTGPDVFVAFRYSEKTDELLKKVGLKFKED